MTDDAPRNEVEAIIKEAEYVDEAFRMFHEIQTVMGMQASALTKAKHNLRAKLDSLNAKLDRYLAGEYCVEPDKLEDFRKWRKSHQPFHWFAEFYGIMRGGGFDVIIGNPPYVEYSKVRSQYQPQSYQTLPCGNIYTFVVERSFALNSTLGLCSLIVPLSLLCTDRMRPPESCFRPIMFGFQHLICVLRPFLKASHSGFVFSFAPIMAWANQSSRWQDTVVGQAKSDQRCSR